MNIFISNTSGEPIYSQICCQLKEQILSGDLKPGEALPSIRALAKDLRVSVITTKRAYEELEKEKLINSVAGKGSFVAEKNLEIMREQNLRKMETYMQEISRLGKSLGMDYEDAADMLKEWWKGEL
ncbi:MAG: GntR family transcriptional regulator [Clostridia bacterium]|nr:GntR family transcriptional regulator [Clostridia bacterium]NCC43861.1 GntR family transcriptional regulator [Clostridia bacterium]